MCAGWQSPCIAFRCESRRLWRARRERVILQARQSPCSQRRMRRRLITREELQCEEIPVDRSCRRPATGALSGCAYALYRSSLPPLSECFVTFCGASRNVSKSQVCLDIGSSLISSMRGLRRSRGSFFEQPRLKQFRGIAEITVVIPGHVERSWGDDPNLAKTDQGAVLHKRRDHARPSQRN